MKENLIQLGKVLGIYLFFAGTLVFLQAVLTSPDFTSDEKFAVILILALLYTCLVLISVLLTRMSVMLENIIGNLNDIEESLSD